MCHSMRSMFGVLGIYKFAAISKNQEFFSIKKKLLLFNFGISMLMNFSILHTLHCVQFLEKNVSFLGFVHYFGICCDDLHSTTWRRPPPSPRGNLLRGIVNWLVATFHAVFLFGSGWKKLQKNEILRNTLFCFLLFFMFVLLPVLPVLPCKRKTLFRKSWNLFLFL